MVRKDNKSENQHYVPRFLLENFTNANRQLFTFDKHTEKVFSTKAKNTGKSRNYYSYKNGEQFVNAEPFITTIEERAKAALDKLIRHEQVKKLSKKDKINLRAFITLQVIRTPGFREKYKDIGEKLNSWLEKNGFEHPEFITTDENVQKECIHAFKTMGPMLLSALKDKDIVLFKTNPHHPFFISDSPVVLHNENNLALRSNLGFKVKGIQIFLPISTTLIVGFLCPSIMKEMKAEYQKYKFLKVVKNLSPLIQYESQLDSIVENIGKSEVYTQELFRGLEGKNTIYTAPKCVIWFNSLQVLYSHRQLYCSDNNFELAREMLENTPECKYGLKHETN